MMNFVDQNGHVITEEEICAIRLQTNKTQVRGYRHTVWVKTKDEESAYLVAATENFKEAFKMYKQLSKAMERQP